MSHDGDPDTHCGRLLVGCGDEPVGFFEGERHG